MRFTFRSDLCKNTFSDLNLQQWDRLEGSGLVDFACHKKYSVNKWATSILFSFSFFSAEHISTFFAQCKISRLSIQTQHTHYSKRRLNITNSENIKKQLRNINSKASVAYTASVVSQNQTSCLARQHSDMLLMIYKNASGVFDAQKCSLDMQLAQF